MRNMRRKLNNNQSIRGRTQRNEKKPLLARYLTKYISIFVGVIVLVGVLAFIAYYGITMRNFQVNFSDKYEFYSGGDEGDWNTVVIVSVNDSDLSKALIENMCVFFPNEDSGTVTVSCFSGKSCFEDDSIYSRAASTELEDLFVQATLTSGADFQNIAMSNFENIMAYSIDEIIIITPTSRLSLNKIVGSEGTFKEWLLRVFALGPVDYFINRKDITYVIEHSYGTIGTADFLNFQRQVNKLALVEYSLNNTLRVEDKNLETSFSCVPYTEWDVMFEFMSEKLGYKSETSSELAQIEIFNGTNINKLAEFYKRWFEHLGIDVLRIENASSAIKESCEKSTVYIPRGVSAYPVTSNIVKNVLEQNGMQEISIVEDRPEFINTGDLVILLCD